MRTFFQSTLLFALLAVGSSAFGQSAKMVHNPKKLAIRPSELKATPRPHAVNGFEVVADRPENHSVPASNAGFRGGFGAEIPGTTTYDLGSNGTESSRVYSWPNGEVTAAWTVSKEPFGGGFTDRGTAYNKRSAWNAGTTVDTRIEKVRTGFSQYCVTASGTEFVVAHQAIDASHFKLHTTRRAAGATAWTEADIPSTTPNGQLWSKVAVDGETIYVIALTTPVSSGGVLVNGMDGAVLLWRSDDAGKTWAKKDFSVPGIDSSNFYGITAEGYEIVARDGQIVLGIFDSWNPVIYARSFDKGDTWDPAELVYDIPLHKYKLDSGYTFTDLHPDGIADDNAPDSLAMRTQDGSGAMLIDNAGLIHMWFGDMYVLDATAGDGTSSYYPGVNGLFTWAEGDTVLYLAGQAIDANGNDTLDLTSGSIIGYGCGLSSMATCAVDADGQLYIAYSASVDNLYDLQNGKNYRHVVYSVSADNGQTWSDPQDVHYATEPDSTLANFQEGIYPFAEKIAGKGMRFIYLRDFTPGAGVLLQVPQDASDVVYIDTYTSGTHEATNPTLPISISPNPTSGDAVLTLKLEHNSDLVVEVLNGLGATVKTQAAKMPAGDASMNLSFNGLATGVYFVRVRDGQNFGIQKVVKF